MDQPDARYTALFNARFNARYAYRVVMRQARVWKRVDALFQIVSGLAGTAAFAAIVGKQPWLTLALGLLLALVQVLSMVLQPASKAAWAQVACKRFHHVDTHEARGEDLEALLEASRRATADDETDEIEWLRPLAYNDACDELGCDDKHRMPVGMLGRLLGWLA